MEFVQFKKLHQKHVADMLKNQTALFVTDVDKDKLWNLYLDSFPPGTNELFRERREYDCSCCRHFVKTFGNVVLIKNNKVITIWDFQTNDLTFQPVIDALAAYVKSVPVVEVFVTKETAFGTDRNYETLESGKTLTWDHFHIDLPVHPCVSHSNDTIGKLTGQFRDVRNVFKRSLDEISEDTLETVLDLISSNSLYRGSEKQAVLKKFLKLHKAYHKLPNDEKELYCWTTSVEIGGAVGKIRNHAIGVLLIDIEAGMDIDAAVRKYETVIVPPHNYMRPNTIFTEKMRQNAKKELEEQGLIGSLARRFATLEDITTNNVLFVNRDVAKRMIDGDVFEDLRRETTGAAKRFDRVEEIPIDVFVRDILPRTTSIEAFFENKHIPNLVSVIAPQDRNNPTLFKWNNPFCWMYNGDIADSMKERVKAAGGEIVGVIRFSIQWNENKDNQNDFDAHCQEPRGNTHIFYMVKARVHPSSGKLDVDIIHPNDNIAVENIIHTNINKMPEGVYEYYVHVYSYRNGSSGFRAEIEFDGQIYSYDYSKDVRHDQKIPVAKIHFSKKEGFRFIESMDNSSSSKRIWNLNTQDFLPVTTLMHSPNYWDEQTGIGNKHFFFILKDCINDSNPRGFLNEYIREDILQRVNKRVFEALSSKTKVEDSNNQLSGIGFSSTQRNSLIVKLQGHLTRTVKLIF